MKTKKIVLNGPGRCYRRGNRVMIKMEDGRKMECELQVKGVEKKVRSPGMEELMKRPRFIDALKDAEVVFNDRWRLRFFVKEYVRWNGMVGFYKFWSIEEYVVGRILLERYTDKPVAYLDLVRG